jgi:hypothetical protein
MIAQSFGLNYDSLCWARQRTIGNQTRQKRKAAETAERILTRETVSHPSL